MLENFVRYPDSTKPRLNYRQRRSIRAASSHVIDCVVNRASSTEPIQANIGEAPAGLQPDEFTRQVGERALAILGNELGVRNLEFDIEASDEKSREAELLKMETTPGHLPEGVAGLRLVFRQVQNTDL